MDNRKEIREFLTSRRAKITPQQAGISTYGSRRVPGLRRGEVAALAGVSIEYYTRLERGNLGGVSTGVLDAVARALQLDDAERTHLNDLAYAANTPVAARPRRRPAPPKVRPNVQHLLAAMTGTPALVRNHLFDTLAVNSLGRALYAPMFAVPADSVNTARFIFLNPRAPEFFMGWERVARDTVGALRVEAGRRPYDRELSNLVGELSTRSDEFRVWWGSHDVHVHRHATKRFRHPVVGEIELTAEAMPLSGDDGQTFVAYSAEPGSGAEDSLKMLASWMATAADEDRSSARRAD